MPENCPLETGLLLAVGRMEKEGTKKQGVNTACSQHQLLRKAKQMPACEGVPDTRPAGLAARSCGHHLAWCLALTGQRNALPFHASQALVHREDQQGGNARAPRKLPPPTPTSAEGAQGPGGHTSVTTNSPLPTGQLGGVANAALPNIHSHQACCLLSIHCLVFTSKQS